MLCALQVLPDMLHGTAERLLRIMSYIKAREQVDKDTLTRQQSEWQACELA